MRPHLGIVGAGLSGSVLARELAESGQFRITVFDEQPTVAGSCYSSRDEETGILVHHRGPHVFQTNSETVWNYINRWGRFSDPGVKPMARTSRGIFPNPINLLTINQYFGKKLSPSEARDFIGSLGKGSTRPCNLEEEALATFGKELYEDFIRAPIGKLWGLGPAFLPPDFVPLPAIRFSYEDGFPRHRFRGVPLSGFTEIVRRILDHPDIELRLGQGMGPERKREFDHLFWSGRLDKFFLEKWGPLRYRTIQYERFVDHGDHQGTAILINCEEGHHYRTTEHKHLAPWEEHEKTVCFQETVQTAGDGDYPAFPLRFPEDLSALQRYVSEASEEANVTFMGRLGTYRYLEMDIAVAESLELAKACLNLDPVHWPKFSHSPL